MLVEQVSDPTSPSTPHGMIVRVQCRVHRHVEFGAPPSVLASFIDADGNTIELSDKEPIFLEASQPLPCDGAFRAKVLRSEDSRVYVSLTEPDGLCSVDDRWEFWVARERLVFED